jgi:ArsR family metal-binding transcriptional regulator
MVVKLRDATEITIVDDGRLIIRNVADEEVARKIAETLLSELVASKR